MFCRNFSPELFSVTSSMTSWKRRERTLRLAGKARDAVISDRGSSRLISQFIWQTEISQIAAISARSPGRERDKRGLLRVLLESPRRVKTIREDYPHRVRRRLKGGKGIYDDDAADLCVYWHYLWGLNGRSSQPSSVHCERC